MEKVSLSAINDNFIISNIYGVYQKWNEISTYSYLDIPRPNQGFMCVLCDSVQITDSNGKKYNFKYGNIFYIGKKVNYFVVLKNSLENFSTLLVNFDVTDKFGNDIAIYDDFTCIIDVASDIHISDFNKIISLWATSTNNYFEIKSTFFNLLNNFVLHTENMNLVKNNYKSIAPALLYLQSHINEDISISDLSKMCLLSETCFRKSVKNYIGIGPSKYRMNLKIMKAKIMLKVNDISINQISDELGFYDVSYFYKVFKKLTGFTPVQYRNKFF